MKKLRLIGLACLGLISICSCRDTLDTHPTESFTDETVWGSKNSTLAFIYNVVNTVLTNNAGYAGSGSCINWESRTPNCVHCRPGEGAGKDTVVDESGLSRSYDTGANRYSVLRQCNLIIEKVNSSEFLLDEEKKELASYGYLLRGMVFFDQARKMGRFVPLCQVLTLEDEENCKVPITESVADSYKYVIEDLKKAVEGLPTSAQPGLPTKWAAGVILSRACLQAYAYTKNSDYLNLAYSSAKAVTTSGLQLSGVEHMFDGTDLYNPEILWGYYRLNTNTKVSSFNELIRTYPNVKIEMQQQTECEHIMKMAYGTTLEGWCLYYPTQDMVDQFLVTDDETGDALPWYETSQYKNNVVDNDPSTITEVGQIDELTKTNGDVRRMPTPQDFSQVNTAYDNFVRYGTLKSSSTRNISDIMYTNRDKRFYSTIIYDGSTWLNEYIDTNWGGNMFQGVGGLEDGGEYVTTTGYYWCKNNCSGTLNRGFATEIVNYVYMVARLGEAYLNLAEAALLKGEVSEAVEALNQTRTIHGGLAPSKASTLEEAWADYIRERNCELVDEGGDLYFSYLRWGKYGGNANHGRTPGDIIYDLDRPVYKIEINKKRDAYFVCQHTSLNTAARVFTTRRYLFPIAQGFLDTREAYGLDHAQNAGW